MNEHISPRVLEILEWPVIRDELRRRCATGPGRDLVDGIRPPGADIARARLKKISALKELIAQNRAPDFSGVADIEPQIALAERDGALKLDDLAAVRSFVVASGRIMRFLKEQKDEFPPLAEEHGRLDRLETITGVLTKAVTENGELNDAAYPELHRLKGELFSAKQEMEKSIGRMIHTPSMDAVLQEKIFTTRNDRYVVLVKSSMKDRVRGTVHDISASGATYYIEPQEITPLNNRALMVEKELQAETARILRDLSARVAESAGPLRGNLDAIAGLDFLHGAARFSIDIKGAEPEIAESSDIVLYGARHPILYLMSPASVVANDIGLGGENRCLVISGANTGGKTVLLKTIGLCVLFVMLGLHVPAGPDSRVGIFSRILADIGDDQSLSRSLSTFSGQIVVINEMLANADDRTLVIIDEIIVGTNPRQGAALAQAILESLIETGSRIVVTTHYSELKDLPAGDGRFQNASVSFDMDTLRPTYRLITGIPGVSYAIEIARNYGFPDRVIDRSRSLLDSRELTMEALIEKMQKHERELTDKKARLDEMAAGLEKEKTEYDGLMKSLEKRSQEIKQKEGIEFLRELREYRDLVARRITDLQKMNMKEAGRVHETIREVEESIRTDLGREKGKLFRDKYVPLDAEGLKPGDRIFIISLEKEGTVETIDASRRTATVLLGSSIRSTFSLDDLYQPKGGQARPAPERKQDRKRRPEPGADDGGAIPGVVQTTYNTVDLRGKRVEEGLRIMEQDFDRMVRVGIDTAVVIHGHGTGAMKEAVRENLRHNLYASGFRPGEIGEGGDGVTIVRLRC
ncbi:MAG: Smr/MutS family protein [Spirochaetes bacterium]|nr:Smr/MutS family protein [Spirochaetota bacterium]